MNLRTRCSAFLAPLAFLLLQVAAVAQDQKPAAIYRITGTVVSSRDGSPVRRCQVSVRPSDSPGRMQIAGSFPNRQRRPVSNELSAAADATGHFSVDLPSAGMWQLSASAPGFRAQMYEHHENFFSSVVLTSSAPSYQAAFRLDPDSSIAGYVIDEGGEPVRNARIALYSAAPSTPNGISPPGTARSFAQTDDRGHYELSGLAPGNYQVSVQAEPWYAQAVRGGGRSPNGIDATPANLALDVIYPITWLPGVTDRSSAEVVSLKGGEAPRADFSLAPSPAVHLRVAISPSIQTGQPVVGRDRVEIGKGMIPPPVIPMIERVPTGEPGGLGLSTRVDANGQVDVGGLSPGLYRVGLGHGGHDNGPVQFLRITGEQRSVDLSSAIPAADLSIHFDGEANGSHIQVALTDVESGAVFRSFAAQSGFGPGGFRTGPLSQGALRPPGDQQPAEDAADRTLEVPPGRYRIVLATPNSGSDDLSLTGISVKGKAVPSRVIAVESGATVVSLQVAHGRASVAGTVRLDKQPLRAAMVLLVPATLGQAGDIDVLRRDQTNTDGSFSLPGVLPGQYILLAIDRGWNVNWHDPATLERYLLHGIPLVLNPGSTTKQDLDAQSP